MKKFSAGSFLTSLHTWCLSRTIVSREIWNWAQKNIYFGRKVVHCTCLLEKCEAKLFPFWPEYSPHTKRFLNVENGKIPTKKVKVELSKRKVWSFNFVFHFFVGILPSSTQPTSQIQHENVKLQRKIHLFNCPKNPSLKLSKLKAFSHFLSYKMQSRLKFGVSS